MASPLSSGRDRDVLRSFARRIDPSDAGAHNNLGVLYYNKGLYEEAVSAFMRALELDAKMLVAQRNLEIAYFSTGYYDKRIGELAERLRVRPDDRDTRWDLGRTFALLGQSADAVAEFTELLRHHPSDIGALVQLGLAERTNGDLDKALGYLERALALDPSSSVVNFYIGEVLYNRGVSEGALAALRRAVELNPQNPDAHYLMGFVLGDLGMHEEARDVTRRAIQLNPALSRAQANLAIEERRATRRDAVPATPARSSVRMSAMEVQAEGQLAQFNLGLAFRQKGYLGEALREYAKALDRGEDRSLVLQAMAEVHLLRREPKAAVALYDELLADAPISPKLWNERGVALHQDGLFAEARDSYRRAVKTDPGYALAHNNLGVALYHCGDPEGAVTSFRDALELQTAFHKARLNLALLLSKGKRFQLALEAYRGVLQEMPEDAAAWNGVGLVLSELRRFEDARNAFARAVQTNPDLAEAHYNLSFTLSHLGDFEGALRETKRALELDSYYVAQKFELAIDLEYENPDLSIKPDLGAVQRMDEAVEDFAFDSAVLDSLFTSLTPVAPPPDAATPSEPGGNQDPYGMAADYLGMGLVDRAAAEVSRALARGAPQAEGLTLLGDIYARQGLHGEAIERYREARRSDPSAARPQMGEAWSLLAMDRARESLPIALSLVAELPTTVDVVMLVAAAHAGMGDPAAALAALEDARRLAPLRSDVHQRIGDIARTLGDNDTAIAAYRQALELDSDSAVVRFQLARLLRARKQVREAEQELEAALSSAPTYAEATLELASLRRQGGQADSALELLISLLERDPYHFDALLALGETLMMLGRMADAGHAFHRILRFDPSHAGAMYFEAVLLHDQKRFREAIARWRTVIELAPASEYARRARKEARTAADLQAIFSDPVRR
ncbi:MAG: tetratricopeptide repeat protein [Gemmatimonadota bacterium]|nr:tetratricopeptide repeat protein [Gemmatimonadota bacterium]